MGEDNLRGLLATKLRFLQRSVSRLLEYSGTHSLGVPGTVRNMIYGSMQKEDFTSMFKTCNNLYNEMRKLHFDQCIHIIEPVLSKSLPVTYGNEVASDD